MSGCRFIVTEFKGYPIKSDGSGEHEKDRRFGHARTTFYVQDTVRLHEVVAVFENPRRPWAAGARYDQNLAYHRRRAETLAKRLNAEDAA